MQVDLIAHTRLASLYRQYVIESLMALDLNATELDSLVEFAGRACYQSFNKPNEKTRTNQAYLANILRQAHESVLEHASATFYVIGSRAFTHELIRHRHLSFSELSQRFVNVEQYEFVVPPAIGAAWDVEINLEPPDPFGAEPPTIGDLFDAATTAMREPYQLIVETLEAIGLERKKAREAARAVMPNATETRIVVTGNLRAWRDVLKKRHHVAADAEIQEFARLVLEHLREIAPNSVQDIPDKPHSYEN